MCIAILAAKLEGRGMRSDMVIHAYASPFLQVQLDGLAGGGDELGHAIVIQIVDGR